MEMDFLSSGKWFPIVGERLLYKKWFQLNLINVFHQHKICTEKKNTRQKIRFTRQNETFDQKFVSTSRKTASTLRDGKN